MIKDVKWVPTHDGYGTITGVYVGSVNRLISSFFDPDKGYDGPYICHIIAADIWQKREEFKDIVPYESRLFCFDYPSIEDTAVENMLLEGIERNSTERAVNEGITSLVSNEFFEKHSTMGSEFWPNKLELYGENWRRQMIRFRINMLNRYRINHGDEFTLNFELRVLKNLMVGNDD